MRVHSQRFENMDLRFGLAKNLKQDSGAIISGGIGLGIIDVAVQYSTGQTEVNGMKFPQYVAIKLGGGFNF